MLQDNSLLFSRPHLAISVLTSFKPEVGHMTTKVGVATNNIKVYIIYSDPKHSRATVVELLEFIVFMPYPVLNSTE